MAKSKDAGDDKHGKGKKGGKSGKHGRDASAGSSAENPFGIPGFDITRMLEQFRLPGLDPGALMENERRNIDAVREANQAVMAGWNRLAEKQAEIFQESMKQWQLAMQETVDGQPPTPEQQAELARRGFEQALQNMRQMAEITADSQGKALEIMRERMEENIRAFFDRQRDRD
ncbi:MAG: phasin family protein [Pseudomonadales bacterium]